MQGAHTGWFTGCGARDLQFIKQSFEQLVVRQSRVHDERRSKRPGGGGFLCQDVLQTIEQRGFARADGSHGNLQSFASGHAFQERAQRVSVRFRQMEKPRVWRKLEWFLFQAIERQVHVRPFSATRCGRNLDGQLWFQTRPTQPLYESEALRQHPPRLSPAPPPPSPTPSTLSA